MNFRIQEHINAKMKFINVDSSVYNVVIIALKNMVMMDCINVFMEV